MMMMMIDEKGDELLTFSGRFSTSYPPSIMVRRAVSTSPESTNHHLNSHHHLSQAQTPTSSTSSLSSASDGQPVSQQPSPSSQQHSPVSVSSASGGGGAGGGAGHGNAGANAAGHGYDVIQYVRPLPAPLPGQPHVHLTPAPHGENGGHGGPAGGGIFIAAGPYAGEYYSDHSYYYPHPDYGSPPPAQHMCPVHSEYGKRSYRSSAGTK
uniref:Uncharacterized protein n=1 Tax=Anopheles stephensi TaxID=30069 RepID=A0A182Y5S9_ANOST